MKIHGLLLYEKYGLDATLEAFEISGRTLYGYKALFQKGGNTIDSLEPKSKAPKHPRRSKVPKVLIDKIKSLRETYPNIAKQNSIICLNLGVKRMIFPLFPNPP